MAGKNILEHWQVSPSELTQLVRENPSLRGMLLGYVAELKFQQYLDAIPDVTKSTKHDDHDRTQKGDRSIVFRGHEITIEVKSLQTNTVKRVGDEWMGKAQVDASDRREVTLPDGSTLLTTCLVASEFDVLAINLFGFGESIWRFAFAKVPDLPRSRFPKYSETQRKYLLATMVEVTWPPRPPFSKNLVAILEKIIQVRCP